MNNKNRIKFTFTHLSIEPNVSLYIHLKSKKQLTGGSRQEEWNIVKILGKKPAKAKI